jgi:hypothetical protein
MYQLVLIERYLPSSFFWSNLIKNKRVPELSVEELLNKYEGFEGELIAHFLISEKDESEINKIICQCLEIKNSNNYFMLHVISDYEMLPPLLKKQTFQVGFDVGVCEEEKTIYSSIFNEVLFGHLDELVIYKDYLNKNLLFPDRSLAEKYVNSHNQLSAQGKGVEDYEEMIIYEIRKQK